MVLPGLRQLHSPTVSGKRSQSPLWAHPQGATPGGQHPPQRLSRWLPRLVRRPPRRLSTLVLRRGSARVGPRGIRAVLAPQAPQKEGVRWGKDPKGPQPPPGVLGPSTQQRGPGVAATIRGPPTLFPGGPIRSAARAGTAAGAQRRRSPGSACAPRLFPPVKWGQVGARYVTQPPRPLHAPSAVQPEGATDRRSNQPERLPFCAQDTPSGFRSPESRGSRDVDQTPRVPLATI
ncbi:hypothetical protein NDU88_006433 [Pleurodeles waltl]|uniref:Uncharacterized protein n=1 Tax=Pleurodeles waltl TaxID=8319 RepID=A0AAV7TDW2_PLEWA|nr:hypothetical protein NDU88_006433 [Pleurodeles waltl]